MKMKDTSNQSARKPFYDLCQHDVIEINQMMDLQFQKIIRRREFSKEETIYQCNRETNLGIGDLIFIVHINKSKQETNNKYLIEPCINRKINVQNSVVSCSPHLWWCQQFVYWPLQEFIKFILESPCQYIGYLTRCRV